MNLDGKYKCRAAGGDEGKIEISMGERPKSEVDN